MESSPASDTYLQRKQKAQNNHHDKSYHCYHSWKRPMPTTEKQADKISHANCPRIESTKVIRNAGLFLPGSTTASRISCPHSSNGVVAQVRDSFAAAVGACESVMKSLCRKQEAAGVGRCHCVCQFVINFTALQSKMTP